MTKEEQLLDVIRKTIQRTEWENRVYLVGGAVRDQIMGAPVDDLDFVIDGNISSGIDFARWLGKKFGVYREKTNPVIFPLYGTAQLLYNDIKLEFVAPRKEKYHKGSRKPEVSDGVLMDDALRRDLTINSLMRNVSTGQVVDLTGKGLSDIKNGIIRTPSDPKIIFKDDPLRMMRVIRFAVKYGFKIEPIVLANIKEDAYMIMAISKERIQTELNKILVSPEPDRGFRLLRDSGLLDYVIEEFGETVGMEQNSHHNDDVFEHTMSVLKNTPPDLITRLIALFHDIGKIRTKTTSPDGEIHFYGHEDESEKMTREILTQLRYPNDIVDAVAMGTKYHMSLKHGQDDTSKISDKSLRKFTSSVGGNLERILDVIHADNMSHADDSMMPNQITTVRGRIKNLKAPIQKTDINLPINGNDLIAMGIKQGPLVGKILDAVKEAWYENPEMTREDAMQIVNQIRAQNEINEIKKIMKSIIK